MSTTTRDAAPAADRPEAPARQRYLHEIDGLRGAAIAIIAAYHIWFNTVSGGVDVFLLLSGFFITGSLLRGLESGRGLRPVRYSARIVRRIFPPALAVAAAMVLMTAIWLPRATWNQQLGDLLASAFYVGNWRLAETSVDYLSSNNGASIVQHYWSLGIQAQFYLLWPLLIAACAFAARRSGLRLRWVLAAAFTLVFAGSFAFALWEVAADQAYAYFDTRARLWQFALGALLVLALPLLRLGRRTAAVLSWTALAALAACGMVLESTRFPGLAAVWPVAAAAAVIVVASARPGAGAGILLNSRPLQTLGRHSYSLYLWHWPVLICYLAATGRDTATIAGGVGVIAVSLALAAATRWAVEERLPATGLGQRTARGAYALGAASIALVLAACAGLYGYIAYERHRLDPAAAAADASVYPGAAALAGDLDFEAADFIPSTLDAADDRDPALSGECNQSMEGYEPIRCDFGSDEGGAERTVVMYGGSKIWQWLPAMEKVAEARDWHLITFIKNACIPTPEQPNTDEERYRSCDEWNDSVVAEIGRIGPDLVFTYGSRVGYDPVESFPDYNERYEQLLESGAEVAVVRDTPSPRFDVPTCVDLNGPGSPECAVDRDAYYPDPDAFGDLPVPAGVHKIDLTDYICTETACPPVVGNILVYRDDAHLTNTYAATLAPYLESELVAAAGA
ncbi:acyltransferase family protein [Glycomyces xiaoerkulensis]|uniref:acyltransferase family protein n=1 Tax=Glycomyces xiaoerkulensis TaxID=2038139 RepID=UPI000C26B5CA|nr:acyltransferase family protein [Glycomyces xiaoerkulensis]